MSREEWNSDYWDRMVVDTTPGVKVDDTGGLSYSTASPRCSGRHWFAYYGWVGSSSPRCVRCGEPNPHYRPLDDPRDPA